MLTTVVSASRGVREQVRASVGDIGRRKKDAGDGNGAWRWLQGVELLELDSQPIEHRVVNQCRRNA